MRKIFTSFLFFMLAVLGFQASGTAKVYTLVTDISDLAVGDKFVITNRAHTVAMGEQTNNNRAPREWNVSFSADFNTVTIDNDTVEVITLAAGTKTNTYAFQVANGYLYAASSSANNLRTQSTIDDNASATISFSEGQAAIVFQGDNTRNQLKYNYSSSVFSCYSTGQQLVRIYKLTGEGTIPTLESLAIGGTLTKTVYDLGNNFSRTGLTATAAYSNGESKDVTALATWTATPSQFDTDGQITVTVKAEYSGKSDEKQFTVTVNPAPKIDSLYIDGTLAKTTYYVGSEFNPAGLKVKARYTDGTTKEVTSKATWTFTPATFTATGTVTVKVVATVEEQTAESEYEVTVTDAPEVKDKTFKKISDAKDLESGAEYVILTADGNHAASVINNKKISTVAPHDSTYALVGEVVEVPAGSVVEVYTLKLNDKNNWTIADSNGSVASNGSSSTNITNAEGEFTISFTDGNAVIAGTTAGSRIWLYLASTSVIGSYASSNATVAGYQRIALYKEVKAPSYKKGDVNGDGAVDVVDINCLVDIIMGNTDASVYEGRAYVNDDDAVDVVDINEIISIILGE